MDQLVALMQHLAQSLLTVCQFSTSTEVHAIESNNTVDDEKFIFSRYKKFRKIVDK